MKVSTEYLLTIKLKGGGWFRHEASDSFGFFRTPTEVREGLDQFEFDNFRVEIIVRDFITGAVVSIADVTQTIVDSCWDDWFEIASRNVTDSRGDHLPERWEGALMREARAVNAAAMTYGTPHQQWASDYHAAVL